MNTKFKQALKELNYYTKNEIPETHKRIKNIDEFIARKEGYYDWLTNDLLESLGLKMGEDINLYFLCLTETHSSGEPIPYIEESCYALLSTPGGNVARIVKDRKDKKISFDAHYHYYNQWHKIRKRDISLPEPPNRIGKETPKKTAEWLAYIDQKISVNNKALAEHYEEVEKVKDDLESIVFRYNQLNEKGIPTEIVKRTPNPNHNGGKYINQYYIYINRKANYSGYITIELTQTENQLQRNIRVNCDEIELLNLLKM